jgi:hypothetical protein
MLILVLIGDRIVATHENKTKVMILTGSYRIKGYIDLLPGARVTDFMQESREFVAVMEAEIYESEVAGRQVMVVPFIDVNRNHIQIITVC